jgi:glycosyltransferase involved in cell wall biosynthesis
MGADRRMARSNVGTFEPSNLALSVLVPAYNEEAGLARSAELLLEALGGLGTAFEVLVVDDGSTDQTDAIADRLATTCPSVRAYHHPVNLGIGGGMITGITYARGEWLILIPADLALDLAELRTYLDAAAQGADVVVGVRSDRRDYSPLRLLVSWVNIRLIRLLFGMEQRQYNYISMYRMEFLQRIDVEYWRSAFFFAEILIKAKALGARLVEVDISYVPRASGRATGANPHLILRTMRDMLLFWVRWTWKGRSRLASPEQQRDAAQSHH